jgi:hypothetical protein
MTSVTSTAIWRRLPAPATRLAGRSGETPEHVEARALSLDDLLSPARWTRKSRDPELRKVLGFIQTEVGEARRLLAGPARQRSLRTKATLRELARLLSQEVERLTIDSAWELAGALKRLNLRLGDEHHVGPLLEYESNRSKQPNRWHGWDAHFDRSELAKLCAAYRRGSPTPEQHARAVDRLTFLYLMRAEAGRERRAKAALKRLYLTRLAPVLFALLVGLGLAVYSTTGGDVWQPVLLAACAGALGSTLSGVFKVRDHLIRLDELRAFAPAMRVQPLVGACAGLIMLLLLESEVLGIAAAQSESWSTRGLLAFVAGFSEPFFLGTVQRVAVVSDRRAENRPSGEPAVAAG